MIENIYLIPNHSKFIYKDNIYEIYYFKKDRDNNIYAECYSYVGYNIEYFKLDENLLNSINLYNNDQNILDPEKDRNKIFSLDKIDSNFLNDKDKESKMKNNHLEEVNINKTNNKINQFLTYREYFKNKFKSYLIYKLNSLVEFKRNIDFKLKGLYSKIYKEFPNGVRTIIKRNNILFHSLVIVKKDNDNFIVEYTIEKEFQSKDIDILPYIGLYLSELFSDSNKIIKELEEIEKILSTL